MHDRLPCCASAAFGLEGLVADELREMKITEVRAENGFVRFLASPEELFICNLKLRFCERVFIIAAEKSCTTFEDLFQLVSGVSWQDYADGTESFLISAKCARSRLMSPRDCQSITKKAVIEKVRKTCGQKVFPESGPSLSIHVSIRNDRAMILLNTSGEALSRRGYRTWNGEAPLRETLAAALVELSGWRPGQPLHDPCCGTGTILTEAALMAAGRAPGLSRSFAMENIRCFRSLDTEALRSSLSAKADFSRVTGISGSDIDPDALDLARRHIRQAGLDLQSVPLSQVPLQELTLEAEGGVFICNPPYGERLSDRDQCRRLYRDLNLLRQRHPTWRLCAISSDPAFERSYGKKAAKKRRLYNGRLECVFYIYD